MSEVTEFFKVDLQTVIVGVIIILVAIKYIVTLIEWFLNKGGIEFKGKREKENSQKLLLDISNRVAKIEEDTQKYATELRTISDRTDGLYDKLDKMDEKIESATFAAREALLCKINEKYKQYIEINGIPEDEMDEFVDLHKAYKGVGGNHSGDAKFEYCIKNIPILPMENNLFGN